MMRESAGESATPGERAGDRAGESHIATIHGHTVVFEHGPTNWGAYVEDVPGVCFTVADTREEAEREIERALDAHLEALDLQRRGAFVPDAAAPAADRHTA